MEVQTVSVFSCFLTLIFGAFALDIKPRQKCYPTVSNETIYDFTLRNVYQNETLDLSQYRGKLVLLVITATYCRAIDQLWGLNDLQDQHGNEGLQVVAVPTNQFDYKEPARDGFELMDGMKYVRPGKGYVPNFPFAWTVDVNGNNEHPLFTYLKPQCPPVESNFRQPILYSPVYTDDIRWNFEKFLIGPDGRPLYKYSRFIDPRSNELIIADIALALKKMSTPESGNPLVG